LIEKALREFQGWPLTRRVRLAAWGVVGVALFIFFFRGVQWSALRLAFGSANPWLLACVVLLTLVTYALRAWRWGYLLAPLATVPFRRLLSATFVGFMSGLLVPRAGEVVRPYLIGRRHDIKLSAAFASIILERLFDLITVLVLFALYLYALPVPASQTRGALLGFVKLGGALAGAAAAVATVLLWAFHAHAEQAMRLLERALKLLPERFAHVLRDALRAFSAGLAVLQAPAGHLFAIAGQSLLLWLSIALGVYLNDRAFSIDLPFHASFLIMGFLTVGVAIPTPGTVGGFHESFRLALTQALGVAPGPAVAAGIALHALTNLPVLVLGLAFLGGEGLTVGRVAEMSDAGRGDPPGPA
jgi:glycosyltransferase 2 family protein